MRTTFSIQRSINSGKLLASNMKWYEYISNIYQTMLMVLVSVLGLVSIIAVIGELIEGNAEFILMGMIFFPFWIISILCSYTLFRVNKLIVIHGTSQEINSLLIQHEFSSIFNSNNVHKGEEIVSYIREPSFWKAGIRAIAICTEKDIHVNISRFYDNGIRAVPNQLFDDLKLLRIKKGIENQELGPWAF